MREGAYGELGDGVVDDGGPDEDENNARQHAATVGGGTDGEGRAKEGERMLEGYARASQQTFLGRHEALT